MYGSYISRMLNTFSYGLNLSVIRKFYCIILVVCIGDADSVLLSPDEVRPAQEDAGIV